MKILFATACASALIASIALCPARAAPDPAAAIDGTTAEQRSDKALLARFFDDTRRSSDMRLKVFLGRSFDPTDDSPYGKTVLPIDELAEQTRGSTDPMVLALLIDPCESDLPIPKPTCDGLELARRWTVADTQNQVAWLTLSSGLRWRGDLAGSREAFVRASHASTWHEYYDEGVRAIAAAIPAGLSPRVRLAALNVALTTPGAMLLPGGAGSALSFHCKDPGLQDACRRIVDTIDRDGGSLFSYQVALGISKLIGLEPQMTASRARRREALMGAQVGAFVNGGTGSSVSDDPSLQIASMERRIRLGELGYSRALLAESHLTESEAAAEFHAYVAARVKASAEEAESAPVVAR